MTKLKTGDKVKVQYVGTLKDGTVFDNSREREEGLVFEIDDGKLLKGFNNAVKNLSIGEKVKVDLTAAEAYGEYLNEAVVSVNKNEFPKEFKFEENGFVQGRDSMGRQVQGQIIKILDESINVDLNHPLAGEDLSFEIELVEIVK
jgi:peptidylprolyl isomerase